MHFVKILCIYHGQQSHPQPCVMHPIQFLRTISVSYNIKQRMETITVNMTTIPTKSYMRSTAQHRSVQILDVDLTPFDIFVVLIERQHASCFGSFLGGIFCLALCEDLNRLFEAIFYMLIFVPRWMFGFFSFLSILFLCHQAWSQRKLVSVGLAWSQHHGLGDWVYICQKEWHDNQYGDWCHCVTTHTRYLRFMTRQHQEMENISKNKSPWTLCTEAAHPFDLQGNVLINTNVRRQIKFHITLKQWYMFGLEAKIHQLMAVNHQFIK